MISISILAGEVLLQLNRMERIQRDKRKDIPLFD